MNNGTFSPIIFSFASLMSLGTSTSLGDRKVDLLFMELSK